MECEGCGGVEEGWKSGGENWELCCVHSIFHPFEVLQYISKCVPVAV